MHTRCDLSRQLFERMLIIFQALKPYGIGVATGEHCANRVMFKQFITSGALQFCQIDSCRLGGPNEILAVYLLAAKYGGILHYIYCTVYL